MAHTSRNDEFTAANPIRWGYGKIDAAAGIEYLKHTSAINEVPNEEVRQAEDSLWYDITGRAYPAMPSAPGIYIHAGKKIVILYP